MVLFPESYLRQLENWQRELPDTIAKGLREFAECQSLQGLEVLRVKYIGVNGRGKEIMFDLRTAEANEKWCEAFEMARERIRAMPLWDIREQEIGPMVGLITCE